MAELNRIGKESLDTIVELDSATNGADRRDFFTKRFLAQEKHPLSFISIGATESGKMVGFVCCHLLKGEFGSDDLIAVLDAISVDPKNQGHGVGHELMQHIMSEIRRRGGKELRTEAGWDQPEVLNFFSSNGFALAPRLVLERSTEGYNELVSDRNEDDDDDPDLSRDKVPVRSLAQEDLDQVIRIDQKITGHDHRPFFERKFQEVLWESGVRLSLIAEIDGMAVGFMMARVDFGEFGRTASEAVIDTLGVAEAFRSQQVGHALLSQLLANLTSLQVESVRSEVEWNSLGLLGFLDSCGFETSQRLALSCVLD